jgi:protein-disulfide isomerase
MPRYPRTEFHQFQIFTKRSSHFAAIREIVSETGQSTNMLFAFFALTSAILMPIPKRYPGIGFGPAKAIIRLEVFTDPLCPGCAEEWPIIQAVLAHFPTQVNLDVHFLPLPYHTWAFVVTRAIIAVNITSTTSAQQFLSKLYAGDQDLFNNTALAETGQTAVVAKLATYVSKNFGISESTFNTNYNDPNTDNLARIEFKYSTSRGVNGTPVVYLNGVESDLDLDTPLSQWIAEIDALIN